MTYTVSLDDIAKVKVYMYEHHQGYEKARPRVEIAQALGMKDRHFRMVCAEVKEIISSHKRGYWILPLVDYTGEETRIALLALKEEESRCYALFHRIKGQKQAIFEMPCDKCEKQLEMEYKI